MDSKGGPQLSKEFVDTHLKSQPEVMEQPLKSFTTTSGNNTTTTYSSGGKMVSDAPIQSPLVKRSLASSGKQVGFKEQPQEYPAVEDDEDVLLKNPNYNIFSPRPPHQQQQSIPATSNSKVVEKTEDVPLESSSSIPATESKYHFGYQSIILKEMNPEEDDQVILDRIRKWQNEARAYLSDTNGGRLNKDLENILVCETYFNSKELNLLYRDFTECSDGKLVMSKEQFSNSLTPFLENNALTDSLLRAIDENGDGDIAFPEFIYALSVMTRGTQRERLRFCFLICDFNRDQLVSREEVYQVVSNIKEIFSKFSYTKERYGSPHEVVANIFSGGINVEGSKYLNEKNELNIYEFIERSQLDSDLSKCFGLFDYFYMKFVLPCDELFTDDKIKMGGLVTKIKKLGILNIMSKHKRRLKIKEGFLIVYAVNQLTNKEKKPTRVIFLPGATVKLLSKNDNALHKIGKHYKAGFHVISGEYSRYFFVDDEETAAQWVSAIRHYTRGGYRFQSFAPQRLNNHCEWFVNASNYYRELANEIRKAKYEIFIAGWWVWPYVVLQRESPELFEKTRLDRLLTAKAKEGVNVHILVWNETQIGIQLGTSHSSKWLESCHPNIKVVRHPKLYPLSWSHHQKSVIIDQSVAFIGGVDICFMRYELDSFPLVDLDSTMFPGKDYGNLTSTVIRTGNPYEDQLDRNEMPRMPWHDVHMKIEGPSAKDAAINFIQRWNHGINTDSKYKQRNLLIPKSWHKVEEREEDKRIGKRSTFKNAYSDIKRNVSHLSGYGAAHRTMFHRVGENPEARAKIGSNASRYSQSFNNNVNDDESYKNDLLNDESKEQKMEVSKTKTISKIPTIRDSTLLRLASSTSSTASVPSNGYNMEIDNTEEPELDSADLVDENGKMVDVSGDKSCMVQILRSACTWSVGSEVEDSCYKAYVNLIRNAKHFVYIQNLFFISSCGAKLPKNRIALAIYRRLRRAIIHKQNFRVSVLTSINPSGDVKDQANRTIIGWTQKTIGRGGQSIIELLQNEFPDVDISQYFGVFSLRNYQQCYDRIFTEQVYIHSKVLIVDDREVVIGSCNINDRSMLGVRDSEIASLVLDGKTVETKMDGNVYMARKFAHTLRVHLWKLHLGVCESNAEEMSYVRDPVIGFNNLWRVRATNNARIYRECFGTDIPENQVKLDLSKEITHRRYFNRTDELVEKLSHIQGYLINYPIHMYEQSDLFTSNVFTPEYYVDISVFI